MAAVSPPRPDFKAAGERAAWVTLGIVLVGLAAFAVPMVLGLMSAVVLHTVRIHAGRVPVGVLVAVNLFDVAALVGLVVGGPRAYRLIKASMAERSRASSG